MSIIQFPQLKPEPLIDERTGVIDGGALRRRSDLHFAEMQARFDAEGKAHFARSHRARADVLAAKDASAAQGAWINAQLLVFPVTYTAREQAELDRLEAIWASAPQGPVGEDDRRDVHAEQDRIRKHAKARAIDSFFHPLAHE